MSKGLGKLSRGVTWTVFVLLTLPVVMHAFTYLYRPFEGGNLFAMQFAISGMDVPLHFFIAGLALMISPVQLSTWLRRRWPAVHRLLGWLYALAVLIGAAAGFSLAFNAQGGLSARVAFMLLALMWPCATAWGIGRAMLGDHAGHRRWMCRSVALTWSAVTLRLILGLGLGVLHLPFVPVYIASAWLGWSINLAVCEVLLRWPAIRARRRDSASGLLSASG